MLSPAKALAAAILLRLKNQWGSNGSNLNEHGRDFQRACEIFDGRLRPDIDSPRRGERRTSSISISDGTLIAVTWTSRAEDSVRVISARRARRAKERQYRQVHG
jgi:uncharacterized DUF497 family protein